MRPIGYSTGALALSDVERALAMLEGSSATAVELSALRISELRPLLRLQILGPAVFAQLQG